MLASEGFFTLLIAIGLTVATVAPIALLIMLVRDWMNGELW